MTEWWYNHKTGKVEEGPQSLGSERDGPFASKEDAVCTNRAAGRACSPCGFATVIL